MNSYELKIFEVLSCDRFNGDVSIEGWEPEDLNSDQKDIREKIQAQVDIIIERYFDIAFGEKTETEIKFFFKRRSLKLFSIKQQLEIQLEELIHLIILYGRDSGILVNYNNFLAAYEAVCKLLSLIYSDLSISFDKDEIPKAEEFEVKYKNLEDETIAKWRSILREKIQTSSTIIEVDGMKIDISEDREFFIDSFSEDYLMSSEDENEEEIHSQSNVMSFADYMRGVKHMVRNYPANSSNEKKVNRQTSKIISEIIEADSTQKEQEMIDFLLETNIAPEETFDYMLQYIKLRLRNGEGSDNVEYLNDLNSRLMRLKEEPKYQDIHRSNFVAETNDSISRLLAFVNQELEKMVQIGIGDDELIEARPKIKLKWSVGQIALMFRLFVDEGDIEMNSVPELAKKISSSFSSKMKQDISLYSIKNDFISPSKSDKDFLKTKLVRLKQLLEKC